MNRKIGWTVFALACAVMLRKLSVQMARLDDDLSVYYHAANQLTSGVTAYTGQAYVFYIYPPLFAWLIAPLALLSPVGYACAWGALLGACWLATLRFTDEMVGEVPPLAHATAGVVLFRAVWNGWGHGQPTLLLSALMLAALLLVRRGRPVAAAAWLALAGAIKLFPLYLGVLFVRPLRVRAIAALVGGLAVFSALPALTMGPAVFADELQHGFLGSAVKCIALQQTWWVNNAIVPRALQLIGIADPAAVRATELAWMALAALLLIATAPREGDGESHTLWLALAAASVVAVTPHVFMHYFTLLAFPLTAALTLAWRHPDPVVRRVLAAGCAVSAIAFNISGRLFVSHAVSDAIDQAGGHTVGLIALWLALAAATWRASNPLRPRLA